MLSVASVDGYARLDLYPHSHLFSVSYMYTVPAHRSVSIDGRTNAISIRYQHVFATQYFCLRGTFAAEWLHPLRLAVRGLLKRLRLLDAYLKERGVGDEGRAHLRGEVSHVMSCVSTAKGHKARMDRPFYPLVCECDGWCR